MTTITFITGANKGIGFEVVTDGEFRRESWNRDFLLEFSNVVLSPGRIALAYNTAEGGKAYAGGTPSPDLASRNLG